MPDEATVKLPRGQSSLRSRLLRALSEGFTAPHGQRNPSYRLRDNKPIRRHSAARLAEQLGLWEEAKLSRPLVKAATSAAALNGTEDQELLAISLMLHLDLEARKRVLSYIESRS